MSSHAAALRATIEEDAGGVMAAIRPFARGRDSDMWLIDMRDGRRLVMKYALRAGRGQMDVEAWMLSYLRHNTELPVPRVVAAGPDRLLMTYVPEGGGLDRATGQDAAMHLAKLHDVTGLSYGFDRDTPLGGLPQPNKPTTDWITFFRDRRLLHAAHAAFDEGRIDTALMRRIDKLAARLEELIAPPPAPSLVHGDVWAGNVLALRGRIAAFIDPALYFADPEVELAFISLFHTFDRTFFERYAAHRPIREGFFTVRKDIYNLYPLLTHVRLYGADYLPAVQRIVERFE